MAAEDNRPPASFLLAEAAADMAIGTTAELDDLLSIELERLSTKAERLQAMLPAVTEIVQAMQARATEVVQDALGAIEEQFDPEEM